MTTLNQTRTFYNSNGRCCLENWVEERQIKDLKIEAKEGEEHSTTSALPFKNGHPGILTVDLNAQPEKLSTCNDSYRIPGKPGVRTVGSKRELLERVLYAKVSQEVHEEFNPPPPEPEFISITQQDFSVDGFVSELPHPELEHNVETEQPVTFWSAHKDKIHGVTQQKTLDTPFKKNSSFSKPIEEQWDQAKPHELEKHPFL